MIFHMALFTSLCGLPAKARLRGRCVVPTGTVAYLALHIFQARSIQLTYKAARKVKADHMAGQTFRIKRLVDFP